MTARKVKVGDIVSAVPPELAKIIPGTKERPESKIIEILNESTDGRILVKTDYELEPIVNVRVK